MSNISSRNKSLAFVILVGGKSARFGEDKGIFEFLGKPLISYQIEVLSQFNHDIFIVAYSQNQIQEYIEKINYKNIMAFILDDRDLVQDKNIRTPMIGMYSAFKELDKLGYEKAFLLSCDMPLINLDVVELLIKQSEGYDCCIPKWKSNYMEPLFAIYPVKKALKSSETNLKNEIYKMLKIIEENWNTNYISVDDDIQPLDNNFLTFINVNSPIDLEKLFEMYQK
ncbi:MAG: molybdenum cofactor guanylyltransferase [Promethearchaeota archaeon]